MNKKSPILLIVAFTVLFGVALGFGYYFSQVKAVDAQLESTDREMAQAENTLEELKNSDIVLAQRGINALTEIEKNEVMWSNVLNTLTKIAPTEPELKRKIIDFLSYSGGEDGRLTFNVQTAPSENVKTLLGYVAKIIQVFEETPDFSATFVPSISRSTTDKGETTLSFILSANYTPSEAAQAEEEEESVARK
ncbi:hypothetical protein ACFLZH_01810 [Patescibacteria group bacterium]